MTSVHFPEETGRLMREVIASYEARVSSVEQIIEATHEMLEAFRGQREAMRTRLRETLARAASLRKRDFEAMMQELLDSQEARERAVKETMRGYLAEQRTLAAALKEALARGEAERVGTVRELLEGIEAGREKREREVKDLLADYQREQEEMTLALGGFLSNGGSVKVKEFKAALKAIQLRRWSRSALAGMLLAFLALWAIPGSGEEPVISRELILHGQDLADQLTQPVAEMKQELTSLGCSQFSLAYWSVDMPTRFRVEVRCRDWIRDVPLDGNGPMGLASHEPTAAGSPR
jgi:hypothetical protein